MGGDIRIDPAGFDIGIRDSWKRRSIASVEARAASRIRSRPARPTIRSAGSDSPTGPSRSPPRRPSSTRSSTTIIVCTVTGSSHAGMIAGFALEDRDDRHVIGIDASATLDKTVDQVTRIARNTATTIGLGRELATTRSRDRRATRVRRTAFPISRPSTRSTSRRAPRGCSPTRCTRASRWPG